jgi:hypothetical protein
MLVLFPDDAAHVSRLTCLTSDPHDQNTHDSATANMCMVVAQGSEYSLPFDTLIKRNEWLRPPKHLLLRHDAQHVHDKSVSGF